MRQLLWKDFRLNRMLVIWALAIFVGLHLLGALAQVYIRWPERPTASQLADILAATSMMAMYSTCLMAAFLGGSAIASERADKTAFFLAYLPPTKSQILLSKLIVALSAVAVIWSCMLLSTTIFVRRSTVAPSQIAWNAKITIASCVLTFGVGWLFSALTERPVMPVCMAIVSIMIVLMLLAWVPSLAGATRVDNMQWYPTVSICVGLLSLAVGTGCYLVRVEP